MNKHLLSLFSVCILSTTGFAQQQKKTYKEVYKVDPEAVLELNTAHADIVLDSWNKNQIEISAEIVLEGASEEEAKAYFKEYGIDIQGNSAKVEINSRNNFFFSGPTVWTTAPEFSNFEFDFNFDELAPVFEQLAIPELVDSIMVAMPEMPPMPPVPVKTFDYDKYKKEGKEYLRKWQSEFEESLDEDYQRKMEEWAKRFEKQAKKAELRAKKMEERAALIEERSEKMEKRAEEMEKRAEEMEKRAEKEIKRLYKANGNLFTTSPSSNRFFFRSNGDTKKYKVKTQIRIKMPKSVKLQLNVKHGEVKLASVQDMKANLSYAKLLASRVDGKDTYVKAAYSPIRVENWNAGELKANYAERVDLLRVGQLNMDAISSNVFIDRLESNSLLTQQMGALEIKTISADCKTLDISTEHGELLVRLPAFPMEVYLYANASDCEVPVNQLNVTENRSKKVYRGVVGQGSPKNNLSIQSQYSKVVLAKQ